MKINRLFIVVSGGLFISSGLLMILMVNVQMRREALAGAEEKALLLLNRNLATHAYFSNKLKPRLFAYTEPIRSEDFFEPSWMSSTYAVREMSEYFRSFGQMNYIYKECAINARDMRNEADEYERDFLRRLNEISELQAQSEVRMIEGEAYLALLKRGETMEPGCLHCHGDPSNAPGELKHRYDGRRSFGRKVGEVASAISIQIPLTDAFQKANELSFKLGGMLLILSMAVFLIQHFLVRHRIFRPLSLIHEKALKISNHMEHLGEEIPIPGGKEVCELTLAFNTMSKSLLRHREQLEGLVRERTEQLSSANEVLGREIEERTRIARSLELERNKLKLILDSMKDGVFITNPEHDIEYANPVVEAEFGPPGGRKCYEYFHGLTETCPQCRNEDVFAGELVSWELFVPKLDKVFENLATQLENCDGTWSKLTIYRDITARKQTEEALRESEEKYREFFEHAPLGIFRTTMEGRFVEANPALAAMLGYRSPSELVASISNIAEQLYVYPEMRGEFVDSVLSGNSPQKKDVPLRCKDGRIRMTRITVRPVRKGEKEWKYLEGIVEDITESKLAEEALHRQNEYLSALHETSLTLINRRDVEVLIKSILNRAAILVKAFEGFVYLYQPSGDVLEMQYATGAFEKRVGFRVKPGEGLVGITYLTGEPHIVENYKDWDLHLAASHLSNQACSIMAVPLRYEEKVKGVLGLARTEEQKKFSEEDTAMLSRFASLASVALDNAQLCSDFRRELTERSLLQDELIRSREAANTANRAKSAFLASMSHELRTPLNAILGFSELILDGRLGEISDVQHENLQYVHQAGKHLLTLINDILDLSKVEAGKMVLTLDEVNLCHLIENIAGMFMGQARKQDIAVQIELGDVPDFIPVDEVKVKQIFYNLLSNALKFTPEGGVVTIAAHKRDCLLRGSLRRGDQANLRFVVPSEHDPSCPAAVRGQCIEITVADTGIGIPPQWLERIFEPFEQIEKVTHKKHKGTGLGLPITRKLVEMHGGRIWAESDGEDGSTFRFILPIHQDKGLHELARCG